MPSPDESEDDALADFEARLAADLEALASDIERVAEDAGALTPGARDTSNECYDTWDECSFCFAMDGGPLQGDFTAALTPAPCEATVTLGARSATYAVAMSSVEGSWTGNLQGDYAITAAGSREATLSYAGPRGAAEWDASWELTALAADTESYLLASWSVTLTYASFADHAWDVAVTGDDVSFTGTVTRDDGVACTVSGTKEAVSVSCE